VWRVEYTDRTGTPRERVAANETAAEVLAAQIVVELNTPGAALQPDISFEALVAAYLNPKAHAKWRSPNTRDRHESLARNHIVPHLGRRRASSITPEELNDVIAIPYKDGYAHRTVKDIHDTLVGIVRFGQDRGVWGAWEKPLNGVGVPVGVTVREMSELIDRESEVPTAAQVKALADAIALIDPEYATMMRICAGAGLRWGELVALRPQDIDLDKRTISVVRQVLEAKGHLAFTLPKHGKTRITTFPASLVPELRALIEAFPEGGRQVGSRCPAHLREDAAQLLFLGARGSIWRRGTFGKMAFRPARDDSAYPGHMTVHSLRHFWVCDLIDRGVRIATVSKLAGHHSPRFTQDRYWGADDDFLDEALNATA
jgi:integrase